MSRNLTWRIIQNILKHKNGFGIKSTPQKTIIRYKHATKGYVPTVQKNKRDIDYHEVKTYSQFLEENEKGFDTAVTTLRNILDVTEDDASKVVRQWKILQFITKQTILKNFDLLRYNGVCKYTLRQHMYVLADSTDNIESKIANLKKIGLNINSALTLFRWTPLQLSSFALITTKDRHVLSKHKNRITYLADRLHFSESMMCTAISENPAILAYPVENIIGVTDILLDEFHIMPKYLLHDLTIYAYSCENIRERLLRAEAARITPLTPWLVYCAIGVIERAEQRKANWERVCSSSTLEEHLSKILCCDLKCIEALVQRAPNVRSLCIIKLTNVLNYLVSLGYTVHDVYRAPLILKLQLNNIKQKYNTWISTGLPAPHIGILVLSKNGFEKRMQRALQLELEK